VSSLFIAKRVNQNSPLVPSISSAFHRKYVQGCSR
jgi:hypothetical protein